MIDILTERVPQLLVTGLSEGAIYALIGLSLTLVYSTTRVVNIAGGEFTMIGAMSSAVLISVGVPIALSYLGALGVAAGVGIIVYVVAIAPAQRRGASITTICFITVALQLMLVGVALAVWGTQAFSPPALIAGRPIRLGSAVVTRQALVVLGSTGLIVAGLAVFFRRTLTGRALVASAINPLGAQICGIRVRRMQLVAFCVGALIAAAAGILIAPIALARYDMGILLLLKGFVAAVVGDFRDYPLTVVGGFALGILEALAAGLISSGYQDAIAYGILIALLMWRALPALRAGVLVNEEAYAE